MLRFVFMSMAIAVLQDPTPPVKVDKTERAEVRLVLLDTVVVDSDGEPVAGLVRDDFKLRIKGEAFTPAVLETRCDLSEGEPIQTADAVEKKEPRRIVLAFDYLHLPMTSRERSLGTAMDKELFVAGPTLGRPVGDDLVVLAESSDSRDDRRAGSASFTPLLVQYLEEPHDLIFLSDACLVGSEKAVQRARQLGVEVRRGLNDAGGAELASIRPLQLDLEGGGKVRCQAVVDVLPSSVLPSGDFVFEASLGDETGSVGFTVELD